MRQAATNNPGQQQMATAAVSPLERLFAPLSIAVLGVSEEAAKLGSRVLHNVLLGGFDGAIYPVNPRATEIQGLACVARPEELPRDVDVAFLALPAEATLAALEKLAERGVRYAIIGSAGYAEGGDSEGVQRQAAITALARRTGMRVVGPNCNGIYSVPARLALGFNTGHGRRLRAGGLAIVSHSGALFDLMARKAESIGGGLSLFVSAGNEADLDVLDYMEHAIIDPATRVIALLLDALPDAARFRELAQRAQRAGKPMVALKLGTSELGAAAAVAHSSRLVGSAAAYRAFLHSCGVATVDTLEGLVTAGVLFDRFGRRSGGIAGFSSSGAGAALIADHAAQNGIAVPSYAAATQDQLRRAQRFSTIMNPTDLGVFGGLSDLEPVFTTIMSDPGVGLFLGMMHSLPGASSAAKADAWRKAIAATGTPVVLFAPGGLPDAERAVYEGAGIVLLSDSASTFEAVAALFTEPPSDPPQGAAKGPGVALAGPRMFTEQESLDLLGAYGVDVVRSVECTCAKQAQAAAAEIGFPVVMKGVAAGLAHKSDAGMVLLGLRNDADVAQAFARLGTCSVVVQRQAEGEVEVMIGITRSADVGLVLVVGLGGIYVEALAQTRSWALPASRAAIARGLDDSALGRVLASPRWPHAGVQDKLLDTIMAVQTFALDAGATLQALDINPLLAGAAGVVAVDALVISAGGAA